MSLAINAVAISALFSAIAFAMTRGSRSASTRHAIWTAALFATPVAAAIVAAIPETRVVERAAGSGAARWPMVVWGVGTSVMLARLVGSYVRLARLKRMESGSSPLPHSKRRVRVVVTSAVGVPQFAGYVRPVILIPARLREDLETVIAHESVHAGQYHDVLRAVQELIVAVFFFSPFVHLLARRADFERELVADAEAARVTGGAQAYAEALARVALGTRAEALAPAMRNLPRRVRALLESTDIEAKTQRMRIGAAMLIAIALTACASPYLAHRVHAIVQTAQPSDADTDAIAHYGSGMSLYRGGHYAEAAREFGAAFERGYDPIESARGAAESYAAAGDATRATAWRARMR